MTFTSGIYRKRSTTILECGDHSDSKTLGNRKPERLCTRERDREGGGGGELEESERDKAASLMKPYLQTVHSGKELCTFSISISSRMTKSCKGTMVNLVVT